MKKQILKISFLSFVLVALSLVVLKVNAAISPVAVSLQINQGAALACTNTGVTLAALPFSLNGQSQTGVFATNSWYCVDQRGTAWNTDLTVVSSILTGPASQTIPAANVKMSTTAPANAGGNIAATTNISTLTSIDSTKIIFSKTVASAIGTIQTTPTLVVTTNANQTPGTYSGTITVSNPSNT